MRCFRENPADRVAARRLQTANLMGRLPWASSLLAMLLAGCAHGVPPSAKPPASDPPGTVRAVASAGALTDAATGDAFTKFDVSHPARLALTGPQRFQADVRLVYDGQPPSAVLVINADETPVQAYKLPAKPFGTWKEGGKASTPTGFFVEVPAGTQQWELQLRGGSGLTGAIRVVPAAAARTPLAATAPVLARKVVAAAPAVTPAVTPTTTPVPTPSRAPAKSGAVSLEAAAGGYVRWSARRFDPVAFGVGLTALRPVAVDGVSAGAAIGWRHHTGGRTFEEYQGRVLAPYIADIDAVPIEAVARYTRPLGGMTGFAQAGAGLEYARSSYARSDRYPRRVRENDWAPTFSSAAGAQMPLFGGTLGARVGVRFARHAFAAHDFELLHGAETMASWQRSF